MPKLDELKCLLNESESVDIIGLNETFLSSNVSDNQLSIDGFDFERRDRIGKLGGGILVYIKKTQYNTNVE